MLNNEQIENLRRLSKCVKRFHERAGTLTPEVRNSIDRLENASEDTIVIEIAHQPNFLPHAGVFRKPILADHLKRDSCVSLFGFIDYDLSTSPYISQNKIPALTKDGYKKIGFKISGKEKWKRFNSIEKPSKEEWDKEISSVVEGYEGRHAEFLGETLQDSYERGRTLSEINAIFISKLCAVWNLDTLFFLYSDLHEGEIFVEEFKEIIKSDYIKTFDEAVQKLQMNGIEEMKGDAFPFWYHCSCGGKVSLRMVLRDHLLCSGVCPVCNEKHELHLGRIKNPDIEEHFKDMSVRAVTRNLIFTKGLGTSIYVSGTGGGLRYGRVSNYVASRLGMPSPLTVAWENRDYYLGMGHLNAIKTLGRSLGMSYSDLTNGEFLQELGEKRSEVNIRLSETKMELDLLRDEKDRLSKQYKRERRDEILKKLRSISERQKELLRRFQRYNELNNKLRAIKNLFAVTPSIVDLGLSIGWREVAENWKEVLNNIEPKNIVKTVTYHSTPILKGWDGGDLEKLYQNIQDS